MSAYDLVPDSIRDAASAFNEAANRSNPDKAKNLLKQDSENGKSQTQFLTRLEVSSQSLLNSSEAMDDLFESWSVSADNELKAGIDALTGLPNKGAFDEELLRRYARYVRDKKGNGFAVVMIDIDNFKFINDTYGHEPGNELMKKIAELLGTNFRKEDFVARWGGDELALILDNADESELDLRSDLNERIAKIDELLNTYIRDRRWKWPGYTEANGIDTHFSVGMCYVRGDEKNVQVEDVTRIADEEAMETKRKRKKKVGVKPGQD